MKKLTKMFEDEDVEYDRDTKRPPCDFGVLARLESQHIVRIYDEGRSDRHLYYTMPYLEGLSLRKIIDLRLERGEVFQSQFGVVEGRGGGVTLELRRQVEQQPDLRRLMMGTLSLPDCDENYQCSSCSREEEFVAGLKRVVAEFRSQS